MVVLKFPPISRIKSRARSTKQTQQKQKQTLKQTRPKPFAPRPRAKQPIKEAIIKPYSSVTNKRTGPNNRTRWNFDKNYISVQGGTFIKILECRVKTNNFIHNKRDS